MESFFSLTLQALLCNSDFFNQSRLIFFFLNMLVLTFASLEVLLTCTAIRDPPDSLSLQKNFRHSDHRRLLSTLGLLLLIAKITTTWAGDAGKLSSNLHTPHLRTSSQTFVSKRWHKPKLGCPKQRNSSWPMSPIVSVLHSVDACGHMGVEAAQPCECS